MGDQAADIREKWIVSACLVGLRTRYDGRDALSHPARKLVEAGLAVPFCPEQAGGLATPRTPAEIVGGDGHAVLAGLAKVFDKNGNDVTGQFIKGAQEMLALARLLGAKNAVLKSLSPSCGVGAIYDGTFTRALVQGDGVAAALLKEAGLKVISEKEI